MIGYLCDKLFKSLIKDGSLIVEDPSINIDGIIGGVPYAQGGLHDYYGQDPKLCPSIEEINKYNQFGETYKIRNACVSFGVGDETTGSKITEIDGKLACSWDN